MLRQELTEYLAMRNSEKKFSGVEHNYYFFCIPLGDSASLKIAAADKLLRQMGGHLVYYTDDEMHALKSGRLGKIISDYHDQLPQSFFPQARRTAIRDSNYARELILNKYRYR